MYLFRTFTLISLSSAKVYHLSKYAVLCIYHGGFGDIFDYVPVIPHFACSCSCFIVQGVSCFPCRDRLQHCYTEASGWFVLEPIQSRCAVLRYSKLTDTQLLTRLTEVCTSENVSYTDDGLEAVIFTAQGDMRQVHLH